MKLILTRHGETIENINGKMAGHNPGRLSLLGLEQANMLAEGLKIAEFDAIYSSDLSRSANTTKEIAKFHKNTPIYYVKELRECDLGPYTGKDRNSVDWSNRPSDVETKEEVRARAKKILEEAYAEYPNSNILFVGHEGINKAIVREILDKPNDEEVETQPNAALSIFEIYEGENKVIMMNSTDHLG